MQEDVKYIRKCIELSSKAMEIGDMPIGAILVLNGEEIAKSINLAHTSGDKTKHAEIIIMREAQEKLNSTDLSQCTLYSNLEPCPMCSFMIRELGIKRVVFSMLSKEMGGLSKYPILSDEHLHIKFPHHFNKPPEIVSGLLIEEARVVWDMRK
jgi:tRNA(adenine34) deaminase